MGKRGSRRYSGQIFLRNVDLIVDNLAIMVSKDIEQLRNENGWKAEGAGNQRGLIKLHKILHPN